jgi:hypothetical protein
MGGLMIISVERRGGLKARGANVDRDRASSRIVAKREAAETALPGPRSEWRTSYSAAVRSGWRCRAWIRCVVLPGQVLVALYRDRPNEWKWG